MSTDKDEKNTRSELHILEDNAIIDLLCLQICVEAGKDLDYAVESTGALFHQGIPVPITKADDKVFHAFKKTKMNEGSDKYDEKGEWKVRAGRVEGCVDTYFSKTQTAKLSYKEKIMFNALETMVKAYPHHAFKPLNDQIHEKQTTLAAGATGRTELATEEAKQQATEAQELMEKSVTFRKLVDERISAVFKELMTDFSGEIFDVDAHTFSKEFNEYLVKQIGVKAGKVKDKSILVPHMLALLKSNQKTAKKYVDKLGNNIKEADACAQRAKEALEAFQLEAKESKEQEVVQIFDAYITKYERSSSKYADKARAGRAVVTQAKENLKKLQDAAKVESKLENLLPIGIQAIKEHEKSGVVNSALNDARKSEENTVDQIRVVKDILIALKSIDVLIAALPNKDGSISEKIETIKGELLALCKAYTQDRSTDKARANAIFKIHKKIQEGYALVPGSGNKELLRDIGHIKNSVSHEKNYQTSAYRWSISYGVGAFLSVLGAAFFWVFELSAEVTIGSQLAESATSISEFAGATFSMGVFPVVLIILAVILGFAAKRQYDLYKDPKEGLKILDEVEVEVEVELSKAFSQDTSNDLILRKDLTTAKIAEIQAVSEKEVRASPVEAKTEVPGCDQVAICKAMGGAGKVNPESGPSPAIEGGVTKPTAVLPELARKSAEASLVVTDGQDSHSP